MLGLMMDRPLLTSSLIGYAATYHGDAEIVSRSVEGPLHRYSYRESYERIGRLAKALLALGVTRCGARNTYRRSRRSKMPHFGRRTAR